jgi:hypothetical protein
MVDQFVTLGSGTTQEFNTGAHRDSQEGKSRPDLISPYAQYRAGELMARGAEKYGDRNWEKGMPVSRFIASLERHLLAYKMGDRTEDHLAAIRFNVDAVMHFEELAKRGDIIAFNMLDDYASKDLKWDIAQEVPQEPFK